MKSRIVAISIVALGSWLGGRTTAQELPWNQSGHLEVPGYQELINVGTVGGKFPHPPLLSGSTLFVPGGTFTTSLLIADVSDPAHPELLTEFTGFPSRAVARQGELLYSVRGARLDVLDVSDLTRPTVVGSLDVYNLAAVSVAAAGTTVFVTGGGPFLGDSPALSAIDVSDPSAPVPLGASVESGGADVVVRDGYAYVASYAAGLRVYDVSSPATPTLVGATGTLGAAGQVRLDGDLAYVLNGGQVFSLSVMNVVDPATPAVLGTVSIPREFVCGGFCDHIYFQGITVSGSTVYVSGLHGLLAIDVSNAAHPTILGRLGSDEYTGGVVAIDGLAVSVGFSGVSVVRQRALPVAVAEPGLDAFGRLVLDGSGSHVSGGPVVHYSWMLVPRTAQGRSYVFVGEIVPLSEVQPGVYDATLVVEDALRTASAPASIAIAVPKTWNCGPRRRPPPRVWAPESAAP